MNRDAILERIKPEIVENIKRRHALAAEDRLLDELLSKSSEEVISLVGAALELLTRAGEEISNQEEIFVKKCRIAVQALAVLHRDATLATLMINLEYLLLDPGECAKFVERLPDEVRTNLLEALGGDGR